MNTLRWILGIGTAALVLTWPDRRRLMQAGALAVWRPAVSPVQGS